MAKARKPSMDDVDYAEMQLNVLKDQIDKAREYLNNNSWTKSPEDKREYEFKFQKGLTDSLVTWNQSYIEISGILDVYKQLEAKKNKSNLKAGQSISGIQRFVKQESLSKGKEDEFK